jgi:hypothetical protein
MLQARYANFAWDKPGTGESTGQLGNDQVHTQRAKILLAAIEAVKVRPDIDPGQIGLWGISQAGYVMPRLLAHSQDVAFMICVSCAGISSYDQMAFQVTAFALCDRNNCDKANQKTALLAKLDRARSFETYEDYLQYREVLKALAELVYAPIDCYPVLAEVNWQKIS